MIKECKKISKMVDELFLYFVKKGHSNINFNFNIDEENIVIDISLNNVSQDILDTLEESLSNCRELEVEEYGWELMGESECSNELGMIGFLIDSFTYKIEDEKTILTFLRKVR